MIETGIDKWLSALTGVSEESKKQFKAGIQVFTAYPKVYQRVP